MDYHKKQCELKEQKALPLYDADTIKYSQTPLGKALYTKEKEKSTDKKHWTDRLVCDICGEKYVRSARSRHNKTKVHQKLLLMNEKMRKVLLGI